MGEIAVGYEMYEEAFEIYKKFGLKTQAIKVLLDHQEDLDRALEYALKVLLPISVAMRTPPTSHAVLHHYHPEHELSMHFHSFTCRDYIHLSSQAAMQGNCAGHLQQMTDILSGAEFCPATPSVTGQSNPYLVHKMQYMQYDS